MVSHTSPDRLRMPPHAVGDRLPWGDCPALSYALMQYPCQRRLDEGRSCSARMGARGGSVLREHGQDRTTHDERVTCFGGFQVERRWSAPQILSIVHDPAPVVLWADSVLPCCPSSWWSDPACFLFGSERVIERITAAELVRRYPIPPCPCLPRRRSCILSRKNPYRCRKRSPTCWKSAAWSCPASRPYEAFNLLRSSMQVLTRSSRRPSNGCICSRSVSSLWQAPWSWHLPPIIAKPAPRKSACGS